MSYLAKIRAKKGCPGTDKTDKTPDTGSSVSFVSTPPGAFPQKNAEQHDTAPVAAPATPVQEAGTKPQGPHARLLKLAKAEGLPAALVHELTAVDLHGCEDEPEAALVAYLYSLAQTRDMEAGLAPDSYTSRAWCHHCGLVWLWTPGTFDGCPWCFNRAKGLPIPRPKVACVDCQHFQREPTHSHLGHCAAGVTPSSAAGLWDTEARICGHFTPEDGA